MKSFIVNGAAGVNGGRTVALLRGGFAGASFAAGVDLRGGEYFCDLSGFSGHADALIDFSHHSATPALLSACAERGLPAVIATTGHTGEEIIAINTAAARIPVFFSANMSLGVAWLAKIAAQTAAAFPDADIEIVERHHNRKLDAPSGTALMLARGMNDARHNCGTTVTGRSGQGARVPGEIGIASVRAGNYIGEHEIIIHTGGEIITLCHSAVAQDLFARGAINAAIWLEGKPAGLYGMNEYLGGNM